MSDPATQRFEVDGRGVRLHVRRREESAAGKERRPAIVVCERPAAIVDVARLLPVLGEALVAAGCTIVRLEAEDPAADGSLRGEDLLRETIAALDRLSADETIDGERLGVLGVGPGAIVAAAVAGRLERLKRVCLLDPTVPEERTSRRNKGNGQSSVLDSTRWSAELVQSLSGLEPMRALSGFAGSVLVLQGAAGRVVVSTHAHQYLDALDEAGRPAMHELVALGNERMDSDEIREVYVQRLMRFFEPLRRKKTAETPA